MYLKKVGRFVLCVFWCLFSSTKTKHNDIPIRCRLWSISIPLGRRLQVGYSNSVWIGIFYVLICGGYVICSWPHRRFLVRKTLTVSDSICRRLRIRHDRWTWRWEEHTLTEDLTPGQKKTSLFYYTFAWSFQKWTYGQKLLRWNRLYMGVKPQLETCRLSL